MYIYSFLFFSPEEYKIGVVGVVGVARPTFMATQSRIIVPHLGCGGMAEVWQE
jgi:hypothetical protein